MNKQTGDLHVRAVLAGEPTRVRAAFTSRFAPFATRASIKLHWRLRFQRFPSFGSSGVVDLGKLASGSKADAESALARMCDRMETGDIHYAETLIDEVHRAITNRNPMRNVLSTHPRFWLEVHFEGGAIDMLKALESTLLLVTIWETQVSMYVREGRPLKPVLRSLSSLPSVRTVAPEQLAAAKEVSVTLADIEARAEKAREAVIDVRARAVLGDLAEDWLANGRRMHYTPWASYQNSYWLDLVELDFLEANLDRYRELRIRTLEQQARTRAMFDGLIFPIADDGEVSRG